MCKAPNEQTNKPNFEEWAFENIVGKGENAGNQHFLHFPKCFLPYRRISLYLYHFLICPMEIL